MMYQFSGVNTITFYAVEIFKDSGSTWDANATTIFMGALRLIFTIAACIAMRRCGRRPLTFVSSKSMSNSIYIQLERRKHEIQLYENVTKIPICIAGIGCGVTMVSLGLYLQYKFHLDNATPPIAPNYTWFPVACIFGFTICSTIGYLVVPWVMIGELYPQKVRGLVGGMTTFAAHTFVFIVVKTYPLLSDVLQKHGTFMLYGVISLLGESFRQHLFGLSVLFIELTKPLSSICRYTILLPVPA